MPSGAVRSSVLGSLSVLLAVPGVLSHIGVWDTSMFCFNGPQTTKDWNTNTVVNPLYDLPKEDYWFGNGQTNGQSNHCYNYPPAPGQFLELPAGGSFDVQFANNRAFTTFGPNGGTLGNFPDGQDHPEYDQPGYSNSQCIASPLLHTQDKAHVAGSAFAISYNSDYNSVQPDNMVVFSVAAGTPWHSKGTFQVPANLPACPPGGCLCGWGWVPNNCGQPNSYLQLFRCKVTGAKSNAPKVAQAQPAVWCENNPGGCTKGAKQMIIWHQAEGNNIDTNTGTGRAGEQDDGEQKSPGYNSKLGFSDGAQNDIFEDSPSDNNNNNNNNNSSPSGGASSGSGSSSGSNNSPSNSSNPSRVVSDRVSPALSGSSSAASSSSTLSASKLRKTCSQKKMSKKHLNTRQLFHRNSI